MFRKVDCIRLPVPDLDKALAFYVDGLGHELVWRRKGDSAGLRMDASDTEIVLVEGKIESEADLLVDSVDIAVHDFLEAGGTIVKPAFAISLGRCAVIEDPWGNQLVILDLSKRTSRLTQIEMSSNPDKFRRNVRVRIPSLRQLP